MHCQYMDILLQHKPFLKLPNSSNNVWVIYKFYRYFKIQRDIEHPVICKIVPKEQHPLLFRIG